MDNIRSISMDVTSLPYESINDQSFYVNIPVCGPITYAGSGLKVSENFSIYVDPSSFLNLEHEVKIDHFNIQSIRSIISFIYNKFGNVHSKANNLNFFFYLGKDDKKVFFHSLKGLPFFKLSLVSDSVNSILFSSNLAGVSKILDDWDEIDIYNTDIKKDVAYNVKSFFIISEITKISVYKWGFNISNKASSVQLLAVMSFALGSKSNILSGEPGWEPELNKEEVNKDPDFMVPIAEWRSNER